MRGSRRNRGSLGLGTLALLGAAALALAFVVGRASAPSSTSSTSRAPAAPVPTTTGAVSTYLDAQAALAEPSLWQAPQPRREQKLGELIASPALRRSVEASIRTAADTAAPIGRALRAGRSVLARTAPLGYRVVSYSPQRAVIDDWVVSLLGGRGIPLDLRLARYRGEERWSEGAWHLARIESVADPHAVRFRGAVELSGELSSALARFERLRSEP